MEEQQQATTPLQARAQTVSEKRLTKTFEEIDNKQLDILDESGKNIVERISTFLAILFAVTILNNTFPPKFLAGNVMNKILVFIILGCYLLALAMGMWAIQPRLYMRHNTLEEMSNLLDRMTTHKTRWVKWASILFTVGSGVLVSLIVSIIWNA